MKLARKVKAIGLFILVCSSPVLQAQEKGQETSAFTLDRSIDYALAHYPAVRASLEQVNSARSGVALARTSYLPQLNAIYQADRATQNQVSGIFLPSAITPALEGPLQPYSATSFWNTQAGA